VSDYSKSTKLLASTTLRTSLGTRNLSEILSDREYIAKDILAQLDSATDAWGITVRLAAFLYVQIDKLRRF
jgi:erythrocyte band 7 integral membrane protein